MGSTHSTVSLTPAPLCLVNINHFGAWLLPSSLLILQNVEEAAEARRCDENIPHLSLCTIWKHLNLGKLSELFEVYVRGGDKTQRSYTRANLRPPSASSVVAGHTQAASFAGVLYRVLAQRLGGRCDGARRSALPAWE